jgi:hypothetical protein
MINKKALIKTIYIWITLLIYVFGGFPIYYFWGLSYMFLWYTIPPTFLLFICGIIMTYFGFEYKYDNKRT